MNVLLLTRYGRLGASSRLRTIQYVPYIERCGHSVTVEPLFSDEYVQRRYERRAPAMGSLVAAMIRRLRFTLSAKAYDVLWIEKELLPFFPAFWETLLARRGIPMVIDYDDAIFHRYDHHRSWAVRLLLGKKIDRVMTKATTVVAGNAYLADRARCAGARRVEVVPTAIDLDRYGDVPSRAEKPTVNIGWIGTPITEKYLDVLRPALRSARAQGATIILIGASEALGERIGAQVVRWSEEREVELLRTLDIGLMPLPDEPWERGKCGYKLIQYMAVGAAVIASPVGVNRDIVTHGENGYLARTSEDWSVAIAKLSSDGVMRTRMGLVGRRLVERRYSSKVIGPRLVAMLESAVHRSERVAPAHVRSGF